MEGVGGNSPELDSHVEGVHVMSRHVLFSRVIDGTTDCLDGRSEVDGTEGLESVRGMKD